jgi:hypothetical protein
MIVNARRVGAKDDSSQTLVIWSHGVSTSQGEQPIRLKSSEFCFFVRRPARVAFSRKAKKGVHHEADEQDTKLPWLLP